MEKDSGYCFQLTEDFQGLLETAGDWAFITDQNFLVLFCYKSINVKDGINTENLVGKHFSVFLPVNCKDEIMAFLHPRNMQQHIRRSHIYQDELGGIFLLQVYPNWNKAGFCGCKVIIQKVEYDSAALAPFLSVCKIMGLQPPQEIEFQRQLRQQEIITALSLDFASHQDLEAILQQALKMIGEFMEVDHCAVFLHDDEGKSCRCGYEWHSAQVTPLLERTQNISYELEDIEFQQLLTRPFVVVQNAYQYTGDTYLLLRKAGIHAFVYVPILVNRQLWGFLGVYTCQGPRKWTSSEFHLLQTICGIFSTCYEKRLVQDELYDAFFKIEQIVNNYPGIIWSMDTDYRFTLFEGLGINLHMKQNILGKNLYALQDFFSPEAVGFLDKTFALGPQSFIMELGGRYLTCETNQLRDRNGKLTGLVGVALDITDMLEMQMQLEEAIDTAEKANQAKSEFLSRMSHEIRTPMNAVIGMNTIAQKTNELPKIQYCMGKIEAASRQLLSIINDILDMSKIEANKFDIIFDEFDFEKMLQNVINVVCDKIEEKKQHFLIDFSDIFRRQVVGDELRLTQVMLNLLTNAIKFTPENGEIALKVSQTELDSETALLRVEVRDNGIGISPEQQDKLFLSFEQADGTVNRKFGGTGLGLVICKKIIDLMGGRIWVESARGQGARFIFTVKVQWGQARPYDKALAYLNSYNLRILVVDDNAEIRTYFTNLLKSFSIHCDTAADRTEALIMAKRCQADARVYDLVFLNWYMPGWNGIDAARALKQILPDHTMVIMISAAEWLEVEEKVGELGITRFITKPVLPSVLFNTIVETSAYHFLMDGEKPLSTIYHWQDKHILLAEDIEINREIIINVLGETGIHIDCAANGAEAVEMFVRNGGKYDLILMDVQMPKLDGLKATEEIRASGLENSQVPIVAMTANAFKEDVRACIAAGMNDHVAKPINLDEMMSKLLLYLENQNPNI